MVKAGPSATYRDVFELAKTQVTAVQPRQHPQIEGARDRELLGMLDIQPMRFAPVRRRGEDQVTLGAGAAHGMTVGSQWAVYSQAVKQVTEGTEPLGLVESSAVRVVTSDARILDEEEGGIISAGTRSVEEARFYGEMRLVAERGCQAWARSLSSIPKSTGLHCFVLRLSKGFVLRRLGEPMATEKGMVERPLLWAN